VSVSIQDGWLTSARRCPSPNYNERPPGEAISLLVVHNISLPPGQFGTGCVEDFFCNQLDINRDPYFEQIRDLRVSAHLFITRDGELVQFVPLDRRAWHAGASEFDGRTECNDFSIGIELEGCDDLPYTKPQYRRLAEVTRLLLSCYPALTPERITGHSDIAPGRKTDPGPAFDWRHFRSQLSERL
jgi:AmpD protein|tara:strand:+ start:132 stop:689 length:558 start_codon:yes stop_codon:yes gene_type:complete